MNEFEKGLLYASATLLGLGLQFTLPESQQVKLTHYTLITLAISIPIFYYGIKAEFYILKFLYKYFRGRVNKRRMDGEE